MQECFSRCVESNRLFEAGGSNWGLHLCAHSQPPDYGKLGKLRVSHPLREYRMHLLMSPGECGYASSTDIKRSISSPTICPIHMSGHSQHSSHWNHISSTWRACTESKSCKRIRKLVAHLQTASLSSKTGPAHPK